MSRSKPRSPILSFIADDGQQASPHPTNIVHLLSLNNIRPDPGQPRHLLPAKLAGDLYRGDIPPLMVLKKLIALSKDDESLVGIIEGISELAQDIKGNGLINPITVYEPKEQLTRYTIETGERRYWAHWYLVLQGDEVYRQIRSLIVNGENSRLRQLSENVKRDGLTAVETAIGLASLIIEMEGDGIPSWYENDTIVPRTVRERVAQRMARGTWPQVVEVLGYTRRHWQHYLNLLKLCDEALEIAHSHRLPERQLRPVANIENPVEQMLALMALIAGKKPVIPNQKALETRKSPVGATLPTITKWQQSLVRLHKQMIGNNAAENLIAIRAFIAQDQAQRQTLIDLRDQIDKILADS